MLEKSEYKITNSLDWKWARRELEREGSNIPFIARDLFMLLCNLDNMVAELSKLEVRQRTTHGHPTRQIDELLVTINEHILQLEQHLLMARLASPTLR